MSNSPILNNCVSCEPLDTCRTATDITAAGIVQQKQLDLLTQNTSNPESINDICLIKNVQAQLNKSAVDTLYNNVLGSVPVPLSPSLKSGVERSENTLAYQYITMYTTTNKCGQSFTVPLEITFYFQFKVAFRNLTLGNVIYSTTLAPKESIRLFINTRQSDFNTDSNSKLSNRIAAASPLSQFMDVFFTSLQANTISFNNQSPKRLENNFSVPRSPANSVDLGWVQILSQVVSFAYIQSSLVLLNQNVYKALRAAEIQVKAYNTVSIGEVMHREHSLATSEDPYESYQRKFTNPSGSRGATFTFYNYLNIFDVSFELSNISARIISDNTPGITTLANASNLGLSIIPSSVHSSALSLQSANFPSRIRGAANTLYPILEQITPAVAVGSSVASGNPPTTSQVFGYAQTIATPIYRNINGSSQRNPTTTNQVWNQGPFYNRNDAFKTDITAFPNVVTNTPSFYDIGGFKFICAFKNFIRETLALLIENNQYLNRIRIKNLGFQNSGLSRRQRASLDSACCDFSGNQGANGNGANGANGVNGANGAGFFGVGNSENCGLVCGENNICGNGNFTGNAANLQGRNEGRNRINSLNNSNCSNSISGSNGSNLSNSGQNLNRNQNSAGNDSEDGYRPRRRNRNRSARRIAANDYDAQRRRSSGGDSSDSDLYDDWYSNTTPQNPTILMFKLSVCGNEYSGANLNESFSGNKANHNSNANYNFWNDHLNDSSNNVVLFRNSINLPTPGYKMTISLEPCILTDSGKFGAELQSIEIDRQKLQLQLIDQLSKTAPIPNANATLLDTLKSISPNPTVNTAASQTSDTGSSGVSCRDILNVLAGFMKRSQSSSNEEILKLKDGLSAAPAPGSSQCCGQSDNNQTL